MQTKPTKQRKTGSSVLALTGAIGSGKSEVSKIIEQQGIPVLDADLLAREVVAKGSPGLDAVARVFGTGFLAADGALDRKKMAEFIFSRPEERKKLEGILHPLIRSRFLEEYGQLMNENPPPQLIVYVIPLYFEVGVKYPELSAVLVVSAPRETCLQRIMQRDGASRELAEKKLSAQIPIEEKIAQADYVIDNTGSLADLRQKTLEALAKILSC